MLTVLTLFFLFPELPRGDMVWITPQSFLALASLWFSGSIFFWLVVLYKLPCHTRLRHFSLYIFIIWSECISDIASPAKNIYESSIRVYEIIKEGFSIEPRYYSMLQNAQSFYFYQHFTWKDVFLLFVLVSFRHRLRHRWADPPKPPHHTHLWRRENHYIWWENNWGQRNGCSIVGIHILFSS